MGPLESQSTNRHKEGLGKATKDTNIDQYKAEQHGCNHSQGISNRGLMEEYTLVKLILRMFWGFYLFSHFVFIAIRFQNRRLVCNEILTKSVSSEFHVSSTIFS